MLEDKGKALIIILNFTFQDQEMLGNCPANRSTLSPPGVPTDLFRKRQEYFVNQSALLPVAMHPHIPVDHDKRMRMNLWLKHEG